MAWSKLVSTELDDEDKLDMMTGPIGINDAPDYPYGMKITLCEKLLKKLDLPDDCDVGDYLDMRCFAVVTSVSKQQHKGDNKCRVELTIEKISIESEMDENTKADDDDD